MSFNAKSTLRIPQGRVGVIRTFSYLVRDGATPSEDIPPLSNGWEDIAGSTNLSITVDGVAAEGFILNGEPAGNWPEYLFEQECFIICPEGSTVQFNFGIVGDTVRIQLKVYGNLLPTHGLPPAFEIASMSNLDPVS